MDSKIIDQYLKEHQNNYKAKYAYYSCDRISQSKYLFHYYVREKQLLQMNIYLTIDLEDEIKISFKEKINEHEQNAIACDALERIKRYLKRETTISASDLSRVIENKTINDCTTPQDMINILNHIMYCQGKNPDSVYQFYEIFMPYLRRNHQQGKYKKVLLAVDYLLENTLNEAIWQSFNIKYLDQEYMMHSAYFVSIFNLLFDAFENYDINEHELVKEIINKVISYWRFAFALYVSLEKITEKYPLIMLEILKEINVNDISFDGKNLVYHTLYSIVTNDEVTHRQSMVELLKLLLSDILSFANPEDQKETGLHFLMMSGFDLLLDIFDETKDSYVYICFPLSQIPIDFYPYIKKQLEDALQYYISIVKDSHKRMEAIDQISKINTILIEYFDVY